MSEHKVREQKESQEKELRKQKVIEAFDKDPNNVILREEVIFGAISTGDNSYGIQCGSYPMTVVKQVCFDLQFRSFMMFQHMEFQKAMREQQDKKIITASGV